MARLTSSLSWLAFAVQVIGAPTIVVDHVDNVDNLGDIPSTVGCNDYSKKAICCTDSVFGVVHTGCIIPFPAPTNYASFVNACNAGTKTAQCCTLNLVSVFNIH